MALGPTANQITVRDVLAKLDNEFAAVADAVENGEYALWIGSGISRQAPNLGHLIERAFDFLRVRAIDPMTAAAYQPALIEALTLAEVDPAAVSGQFPLPLAAWPGHDAIIERLWNQYSRVLDIRIAGTEPDFILWDAIDIRQAFSHPKPPAAEHLCIAILVLEGAVGNVASANWDGFIEAAVDRLSGSIPGILQVVVDPDQLRAPPGRARLLKFHGCIVHATAEPQTFRRWLTGSYTQIMDWPEAQAFGAMRNQVVALATAQKTLVLGLSIQDNNLQTLFARAKAVHAWPWPPMPAAPAHVFCEDQIQQGQRDVLRLSYGEAYNADPAAVHEATLMRAWAEKVLISLVLRLVTDKLVRLMELCLAQLGMAPVAADLAPLLVSLRDLAADFAVSAPGEANRTAVVNRAIMAWSRLLSLFRNGADLGACGLGDQLTHSLGRLLDGYIVEVCVAGGRGDLRVSEELADHRQGLAPLRGEAREAVPEIVKADVVQAYICAQAIPERIEHGAARAAETKNTIGWLAARQAVDHRASSRSDPDSPRSCLAVPKREAVAANIAPNEIQDL